DHQSLDEGLFEVLSGVDLTLSSLTHTLMFQPATLNTDMLNQLQQLQVFSHPSDLQSGLSAELTSLGAILTSRGSEVIKLLGSGSASSETSTCFDLLTQRVCDIQKTLAEKQEQLQERMKHTTQLQ
ncbi:hypothetical protein M9458_027247, partial [Cirrhinus mrigala]